MPEPVQGTAVLRKFVTIQSHKKWKRGILFSMKMKFIFGRKNPSKIPNISLMFPSSSVLSPLRKRVPRRLK